MKFYKILKMFMILLVCFLNTLFCEDYRIQPGDEIEIFVWQSEDFTRRAVVQLDGTIPYPIIGTLKVGGKTPSELEKELTEFLSRYIKYPQVSVLILNYAYRQVAIIGEVRRPGTFPLVKEMKLTELVAKAEGYTSNAYLKKVFIIRNKGMRKEFSTVNLKRILRGDEDDVFLVPGDIVYIPKSAIGSWNWFVSNVMPTLTLISVLITLSLVL